MFSDWRIVEDKIDSSVLSSVCVSVVGSQMELTSYGLLIEVSFEHWISP